MKIFLSVYILQEKVSENLKTFNFHDNKKPYFVYDKTCTFIYTLHILCKLTSFLNMKLEFISCEGQSIMKFFGLTKCYNDAIYIY